VGLEIMVHKINVEKRGNIFEVIYRVHQIVKTSKYDQNGMPAYLVRSEIEIVGKDKESE